MRLYGGRIIKNQINRQLTDRQELRDAVVMDVNSTERYCRVKIQGSNTYIKAWYPENWEQTPVYLKPGNAVRITLPGGNKSRIEVTGFGMLLPTAVSGGSVTPPPYLPTDTVLTGCDLLAANPNAMAALVSPGTYRINNTVYSLCGMIMDRPDIVMNRSDLVMDEIGGSVVFDAASSSYYRYDIVVAGTDGLAHVVKGDEAADEPIMPGAPADHVIIGHVFIYPNMTVITDADINRNYYEPVATELRVTIDDDDLAWDELSTTITISMCNQYGNPISKGGAGYHITFSWLHGNGMLSYGSESQDESADFSFYMDSTALVTYTRNQLESDKSPQFDITESATGLENAAFITLRDISGNMMF